LARLLDTASKFALFLVSGLKDEKLIKNTHLHETETCKLCSRVFWTFQPNNIKIDPYNLELYCYEVGAFFQTQCSYFLFVICWWLCRQCTHDAVDNCFADQPRNMIYQ